MIKDCRTCQHDILRKYNNESNEKCHNCFLEDYYSAAIDDRSYPQYEPFDFHVGDYVEALDGDVGYINRIDDKSYMPNNIYYFYKKVNGKDELFNSLDMKLGKIKRVGKYDFSPAPATSKDKEESQPKIENIHSQVYLRTDTKFGKTKAYYRNTNMEDVLEKLNEIIDYINKEK